MSEILTAAACRATSTSVRGPSATKVRTLYESRFVDRYDVGANVWERFACEPALAAFDRCLRSLPNRPLDVLDLGCGTGRNLRRLATAGIDVSTYTAVDSSVRMLERARRNHPYSRARFVHGDATEEARVASGADLVLLTWVLSHQPDPARLLAAARRALSPEGRLLVLALTKSSQLAGRAHGWRFRRTLHANPIDPRILNSHTPTFVHVSCSGLITMAEFSATQSRMGEPHRSPRTPTPARLPCPVGVSRTAS